MNDLIDTIFGDDYISLQCNSGECLHYSQVPGYEVSCEQFSFFIELDSLLWEEPSNAR